jgi:hypothetical protein
MLAKHYKTLFIKHVFPRFSRPVSPPFESDFITEVNLDFVIRSSITSRSTFSLIMSIINFLLGSPASAKALLD